MTWKFIRPASWRGKTRWCAPSLLSQTKLWRSPPSSSTGYFERNCLSIQRETITSVLQTHLLPPPSQTISRSKITRPWTMTRYLKTRPRSRQGHRKWVSWGPSSTALSTNSVRWRHRYSNSKSNGLSRRVQNLKYPSMLGKRVWGRLKNPEMCYRPFK